MKRGTKIIHNRIKCKTCGAVIESKNRHDMVCCICFAETKGRRGVYCDGGHDYLRRGGDLTDYEELSETRPYTDEERDDYNERKIKMYEKYGWNNPDLME